MLRLVLPPQEHQSLISPNSRVTRSSGAARRTRQRSTNCVRSSRIASNAPISIGIARVGNWRHRSVHDPPRATKSMRAAAAVMSGIMMYPGLTGIRRGLPGGRLAARTRNETSANESDALAFLSSNNQHQRVPNSSPNQPTTSITAVACMESSGATRLSSVEACGKCTSRAGTGPLYRARHEQRRSFPRVWKRRYNGCSRNSSGKRSDWVHIRATNGPLAALPAVIGSYRSRQPTSTIGTGRGRARGRGLGTATSQGMTTQGVPGRFTHR